jgi:hypothetical protein
MVYLKSHGRRPLGKPSSRWQESLKMDLQEVGSGGGGAWTGLIWLRTGGGLL